MNRRMKAYRGDGETHEEDQLVESQYEIKTANCGYLNVYVKGDPYNVKSTTAVFLTLHDLGTNHQDFHKLIEHPCMCKIKQRSVWIHVDMPGQEYDALDLPPYFDFPTFDQMCDDLIQVLDYFSLEHCFTFGEGAGANILIRFSMKFPDKVIGNILIHCMPNGEKLETYFQEKYMCWKLNLVGMNTAIDQYLCQHKFGMDLNSKKDPDEEQAIKDYLEQLHKRINVKNFRPFFHSHLNRTDISKQIQETLQVDTMIICGSNPSQRQKGDLMQALINPKLVHRLNIDYCTSVLDQSTDIVANNLILFCQGLGVLSSLSIRSANSFSWY